MPAILVQCRTDLHASNCLVPTYPRQSEFHAWRWVYLEEAIDTVFTDIPDLDGLRRECREGVAMSFAGKISIHPGQIEVINQEFTPSRADADDAAALIAAFEAHAARGAGAFAWKGQMVDMPHLTGARKIVERARQAGVI